MALQKEDYATIPLLVKSFIEIEKLRVFQRLIPDFKKFIEE